MELKLFIIIVLVLALIAVSGLQGCEGWQQWQECYTDGDCAKVQTTCCPCNMGGVEICTSETLAPLYEEKLKDCPAEEDRVCIALDNCKIITCLCKNGRCIEKAKK